MNKIIKHELENKYNAGKKYLRAKEVASYLYIGVSTVWLYAKEGKITPRKLSPRVTVFELKEIENLFNEVA